MSAPIPTHTSARDDGGGGHPYRHFDRSEAEWRNLLSLMVRAALRREISRLRVSSERLPSAPYRHAAPLEMTVAAGTPIVISTVAKRSGEISPSDGTGSITVGDLSTQSIIGAVTICPIPTRSPARDDGSGGHPYRHFDHSGVEKSPFSDCTGGITAGDLSTQSIMGAVLVCPHTDTYPRSR